MPTSAAEEGSAPIPSTRRSARSLPRAGSAGRRISSRERFGARPVHVSGEAPIRARIHAHTARHWTAWDDAAVREPDGVRDGHAADAEDEPGARGIDRLDGHDAKHEMTYRARYAKVQGVGEEDGVARRERVPWLGRSGGCFG